MTDQPKVYKKRARLQLSKIEMEKYRPTKKGIAWRWYEWDPIKLSGVLELIACDGRPNPLECRTMEDIDSEFARLAPRIIEDNPHVLKLVTGIDVRIESNLHTPSYRNGRWDKLVDSAKDVHTLTIKKNDLQRINDFYSRRRAVFGGKTKIEGAKEKPNGDIECEFGTVFEG